MHTEWNPFRDDNTTPLRKASGGEWGALWIALVTEETALGLVADGEAVAVV